MRASMSQYLSDSDSDSDIEIDASKHNRFNKFKASPSTKPNKPTKTDVPKKKPRPAQEEEDINEKLELSISDVKVENDFCTEDNNKLERVKYF